MGDNGRLMGHTLLAFHAHPDDEALLTAGTMAKAAAQGHRVVLATATDGALGLTSSRYAGSLPQVRSEELAQSAALLGVARVVEFGYADSGLGRAMAPDPPGQARFARVPTTEAATRLAEVLREESVDVVLSYDRNGGYGHPDHRQVHKVARAAAALAGTPRLLEVWVSPWVARVMGAGRGIAPVPDPAYVVDVREFVGQRRDAIRAHRSQLSSDGWLPRNNDWMTRLPTLVLARAFGTERYVDPDAPVGSSVRTDVFEGL